MINKKRTLLILFLLIVLTQISITGAVTVTLTWPEDNQINTTTDDIAFKCKATWTDGTPQENIANLSLYHNITGTFDFAQVNATAVTNNQDYEFSAVNDIAMGSYIWNCMATSEDNTPYFASANFTLTISNSNPIYTEIPNMTWPEDIINNSLNLSNYFSDPDGEALTYASSTPSNIGVSIDVDLVTLTPNANFSGTSTTTFTATDPRSLTNTSNTVNLNIIQVNDPPLLTANINNITWSKNTNEEIDLSDYFTDIDSSLNYSSTPLSNINVSINNETRKATLTPQTDWAGSATITFIADDGEFSANSNTVNLGVISGNSPPVINSFSPTSTTLNLNPNEQQNFIITKSDADNDAIAVSWYLGNEVIENATSDSYTLANITTGVHTLKVVVSDSTLTDSQEWSIIIGNQTTEIATTTQQQETVVETQQEAICGNNKPDPGENCGNCPTDAACKGNFECINNKCIKQEKPDIALIAMVLIIIIGATLALAFYLHKKHERSYYEFEETKKTVTPVLDKIKEHPSVELEDIYKKRETAKPSTEQKTVSSVLLKDYIRENLKKGISSDIIKKRLLDKGWDKSLVEKEILNAELDTTIRKAKDVTKR